MPDAVLRRFESGQHISQIIEIPPEALRWSTRYNAATEANQGTYEINAQGIMIEKATGTWPRFGYGMPFAQIDPHDPKAPYKIMYNFFRTLVQWDDINVLINFFWTTPTALDRYVDFRGQAISYFSRWSGPVPNPDDVAVKVLIYGMAPYDVVGLATLDWNYLDPTSGARFDAPRIAAFRRENTPRSGFSGATGSLLPVCSDCTGGQAASGTQSGGEYIHFTEMESKCNRSWNMMIHVERNGHQIRPLPFNRSANGVGGIVCCNGSTT